MLRFIRLATMALPAVLWLVRKIRERRGGAVQNGAAQYGTAPNPAHHPTSVHNSRAPKGRRP